MEQTGNDKQLMRIVDLPEELVVMIFTHIDPLTLKTSGQVCKDWRRIVSDERSWKRAFVRTFGRLPYERLLASSVHHSSRGRGKARGQSRLSWQNEYTSRVHLTRQWAGTCGGKYSDEQRLEFNARVGTVDRIIVSEKHGWALAVSKAGRAGVRCDPSTGKVFARKNELRPVVFAMPRISDDDAIVDDGSKVSAVSTRSDRILWGFESGLCTVTHLTRYGELKNRVVAARYHTAPVLDVAGPLDHLAQKTYDWRNKYRINAEDDLVASSSASGSVYVWLSSTGQSCHFLQGVTGIPLVRVTWAEGARYVVAASSAGVIFVWDLSVLSIDAQNIQNSQLPALYAPNRNEVQDLFQKTPWLTPEPDEYSDGRIPPTFVFSFPGTQQVQAQRVVQLVGDPFDDSFVIAVEGRGVWRIGVDGTILAMFSIVQPPPPATVPPGQQQPAPITVMTWKVDSGPKRQLPGSSRPPSCVSSAANLSPAASGAQTPKGKAPDRNNVLRLDLTKPTSPTVASLAEDTSSKRLLLIGDATGSLWMFDADETGEAVQPLHAWPRIHQRAISAIDVNAAVLVSAARDGQVLVIDPLSGRTLRTIRCHGGGRSLRRDLRRQRPRRRPRNNNDNEDAHTELEDVFADPFVWQHEPPNNVPLVHHERRLDPRFWWVHLPIINENTRGDVYLAQMLASRTSEQWEIQVRGRGADALDMARGVEAGDEVSEFYTWLQVEPELVHGFPTLVADVVAGHGWVVVANGTRIHSCFLGQQHMPQPKAKGPGHSSNSSRQRNGRSGAQAASIVEELAELQLETRDEREWRIEEHENRAYIEREFMQPTTELGLSADEQIAYALWLSQQDGSSKAAAEQCSSHATAAQPNGSALGTCNASADSIDGHRSLDSAASSDGRNANDFTDLALEDMTEEEQLEYALFLSSAPS
ncbi:hypothetical protein IW140_003793 [Coemansia sp. RSA 1813]|nr:hypothetical protein LPJ74_005771 [Coemansia sp. RSA 1843]KAJ2088686.1 hypothetical protein IW138_004068 [Coemansia sp. RSA 986]KAJ2213109.1 hypothetical protein EV179_004079 [Coemansia sp. RSA 487]KAJ2568587.1 hypothetical protein IW140_003793 [Coemansia sp. RSA 1813]